MPSIVDMVNRTLSELGKLPIVAVSDSDFALVVSNKLAELAPEVLQDYNWNFAVAYVANYSPETTNFSPDYVYSYQLPGDYGKFFAWATTGAQWPIYAIIDGMMLANTLPIQYYYIRNYVDFQFWPPLVARMLVLYTAHELAAVYTQNPAMEKVLQDKYEKMRVKAITWNDMERSVQSTPYNDFNRITFV